MILYTSRQVSRKPAPQKHGMAMNKYRKLMSDTFILGIGTFASKVLVILLMPLYTEYLSSGQYNVAELINQTANLLMPLACVGVCDGLFRFTLDSGADRPSILKTGLTVLFASSAVFIVLSPLLYFVQYFQGYTYLIILFVLAANLHLALAQYVRASDRPRLFALQGIINTLLVIGFNVLFLVRLGMGIEGFVLSVIISDLAVSIFLIFAVQIWREFSAGRFDRKLMRDMVRYSLPMIPTAIFWWITNISGRIFITHFHGNDISGLYTAALKIPTLLTLLCTVFYEAWQFSAVKDAEGKTHSGFFGKIFSYYSSLMFAAGAGIILLGRVFVSVLFADSYSDAWVYIPALTGAAVFSALTTFMGSVYLVKKKSKLSFFTSMAGAAVNLAMGFLLVPAIGAQGAAIAAALSFIAVFVIRAVSVQKYVRFFVNYLRLTVNTLLLAAMGAVSVLEVGYWQYLSGGLAVLILLINARTLFRCAAGIFGQLFVGRRAGNDKKTDLY